MIQRSARSQAAIIAELVRAVLGAAQFLVAVRVLGSGQYGAYAQVVAVAVILTPLVLLAGTYWVQPAVLDGVDPRLAIRWCLLCALTIGPPAVVLACLVVSSLSSEDVSGLLLVCLAEVVIFPAWLFVALAWLASDHPYRYAGITAIAMAVKLTSTTLVLVGPWPSSLVTLGASLVVVGGFGLSVSLAIYVGWPLVAWKGVGAILRPAASRGSVALISGLLGQADKVAIGGLVGPAQASAYNAAARLAVYPTLPARALATSAYGSYFEAANRSQQGALRLATRNGLRQTAVSLPIGVLALIAVALLEPLLLPGIDGVLPVFAVMLVGAVVKPFEYAYGDLLYALGGAHLRLASMVIMSAIFVGFLTLSSGASSGLTVALAALACQACLTASFLASARRRAIQDDKSRSG